MRAALALLIGWLLVALVLLALDGRRGRPRFAPGPWGRALVRQQRAHSMLDQPPRPYRYRVADDLHQTLAAVVTAAEHDATTTPVQQPPRSPARASRR
jgi:hypothetical protein